MKAAIIQNSVVVNIAKVADAEFANSHGWVVSDIARIGDRYDAATGNFQTPETDPEHEPEPEPETTPKTPDDLRQALSAIHKDYSNGTTLHRGIEISIDIEARVNARGTLDAVRDGSHPLPFRWFRGGESILVESVEDMQAIHDAIFHALRKGFEAKAKVLAAIDSITNPDSYSVAAAFRAHLRQSRQN